MLHLQLFLKIIQNFEYYTFFKLLQNIAIDALLRNKCCARKAAARKSKDFLDSAPLLYDGIPASMYSLH